MSAADPEDFGAKPNTWNALVRRARIGMKRKAAALVIGTYAGPTGRDVKCGVARLAADLEVGYSTARRYLAWLREVGLIELVKAGNHRRGRADEYRLIIGPDVAKHIEIPEDDEYRALVEGLSDVNYGGEKNRRLRSPIASADPTEPEEGSALNRVSAEPRDLRSFSDSSALTLGERPPSNNTLQERAPSTGGAPPPDPRRRPPPSASANEAKPSLTGPLTPAQDQQGDPLPHANARGPSPAEHVAPLIDFFTREVS
ncbi:MAG: hypothetical protein QOE61_3059 [Micromonosporaceae bacterium]|nr:hypothetical protein [Micromonosporaceae bacterium]